LNAILAWTIVLSGLARKNLAKMDAQIARRITAFLRERVANLDNPRNLGHALQGSDVGHLWRYRMGNDRIVCEIQDAKLIVLVVHIGHRREVYR
jgi:mRNA interferase RelE/StbE